MFLKKAEGSCFRNYEQFSIEFTTPVNVFTGENGQGKSSFLEALYCCFRGKSFYPFISYQFIQNAKKRSRVCLTLEEEKGLSVLSADFFISNERLGKELYYCGKKVGHSFLAEKFPIFVFTEESMKSIRQGAEQRRVFVDEMLGSLEQKRIKDKFNRILKEKRQLLKNAQKGEISIKETRKILAILNPQFLQYSYNLVLERLNLLNQLFSVLKELKKDFFRKPLPELDFYYGFSKDKLMSKNTDVLPLLKDDLERKTEIELKTGQVFSGPHKHDIGFLFNGGNSRVFCSKGEQRTFALSLLGSHISSVPEAFLFLDDVLMELDEDIQKKFLKFIEKNNCQTFLTNCNLIPFKTKNVSFFSVKNAIISKYG